MSPERSNSPQSDVALTPKLSVPGSPVAGTPIQDATSPFSFLLAVAQSQSKITDDDLTSLSWLQNRDLLKDMNINPSPSSSMNSTPVKHQTPESSDGTPPEAAAPSPYTNSFTPKNKHPHNIPYDPLVHTNNKPPYSFSCLIFMAIEDSPQKALPVKEIYAWILEHFPYFKNAPTGWKNSVRHNLSLNKCFQKVEKAPNLGKGSLWTVDPQYKPNLIQALTRSPFHPCANLDPTSYMKPSAKSQSDENNVVRLPNPQLFPYLARKLASTQMDSEESLDERDAAAVMLSLKNGPRVSDKKIKGVWQIITTSPSQDHTYSAGVSSEENDDDRLTKSKTCRKIDFEDDEERRIKEGAETLLNLAHSTRKRNNSGNLEGGKIPKLSHYVDVNENEAEEKHAPFKPRLLRRSTNNNNNNKILSNNNNNDEWSKHRRELEICQNR
ncbi:forkhead box protein N3-like isoform X2 [Aethina tumida]|uniref:forkhead box protein N3-like isoform X2 n=1 Tax=Aethina tumida TaxID=116153 RepID=UPI00096B4E72|nr:forkhead box protein N3-like isoform X2 [Aethina tumida]